MKVYVGNNNRWKGWDDDDDDNETKQDDDMDVIQQEILMMKQTMNKWRAAKKMYSYKISDANSK